MQQIIADQRTSARRSFRGGGRRVTDPPAESSSTPRCPNCHQDGLAVLAGEAEGGWWFVCVDCDHLWDQREIANPTEPDSPVIPREKDHDLEAGTVTAASARLSAIVMAWWRTLRN